MLKEYLSQPGLVARVLTQEEITDRIFQGKPINILMGQTYDSGQPIDLLKYCLFIINLQSLLRQERIDSRATILLADHFMTNFNKEMSIEDAYKLGEKRQAFLERVNEVYNGGLIIQYSSNLSKTREYREIFRRLEREKKSNQQFRDVVLQAVPEKRRDNPDALRYPLEEIACIVTLDTDIKVGPRYEIFYDGPAKKFAKIIGFKPYCAIHLTNSRIFGERPKLEEKVIREIEEFGILPYQIMSKGLSANRIDLGNFTPKEVNTMIDATEDKRSLVDLLVISELAKQCIERKPQIAFYSDNADNIVTNPGIALDFLRDKAKASFGQYITPYFS